MIKQLYWVRCEDHIRRAGNPRFLGCRVRRFGYRHSRTHPGPHADSNGDGGDPRTASAGRRARNH